MGEMLNQRSQIILEAIIENHIESAEPVGSRTVTKRHGLGLSPATVRNVMADLEEMGFIASPHTSAGRVPTELGYRYYVDSILQWRGLTPAEQVEIEKTCGLGGLPFDNLLSKASAAISRLARYTGIVMAPRFNATIFRQMEFVKLSHGRILVIMVSKSGLVQNKLIAAEDDVTQGELEGAANYLNEILGGLSISEARAKIKQEMQEERALYDRLRRQALTLSSLALKEMPSDQIFIEGTSYILEQPEFADIGRMRRLLKTLEQKNLLLDLLDKSQAANGVQIFIGSQSEYQEIEGCSLITAKYSSSDDQVGPVGTIGVIGPMRMPYSQVIPIVDFTARLVSQILRLESE